MLQTLQQAADIVARLPEDRSCRGCDNFDEGGQCGLYRMRVPAEHIEQGCDSWIERVPF